MCKYTHNFWKKMLGNGVGNGEGERNGEGVPPPHSLPPRRLFRFPLPSRLGVWGSVVSSFSGVRNWILYSVDAKEAIWWHVLHVTIFFAMADLCDGGPSRHVSVAVSLF